jgi:hypothetical protein
MAKQRYVNTYFWDDDYISDLQPDEKLLFLYLLTNPLTEISGAYKIALKRIAYDTGIEKNEVTRILAEFEANSKVIYKDGWILICNFIKHQVKNPKVIAGILRSLKDCPQWIIDSLSKAIDSLSHLNSNSNLNSNSATQSGAQAAPVVSASLSATEQNPVGRRIWNDGIDLLTQSGVKESSARSLLGRLAKEYGNESLAECIAIGQAKNPVNAEEFLVGTLKARKAAAKNGHSPTQPKKFLH